jgi:hypothetical protein
MPLLNEPLGYEPQTDEPEWSPAIGYRRGLVHGVIAMVVLALLMAPLAMYLPYMILPWVLRTPLAFGLAWLLFLFIERAAGFMSPGIIALTMLLTFGVFVTNHVVFALHGVPSSGMAEEWWIFPANLIEKLVPEQDRVVSGWQWLHPYALVAINVVPLLVGGGFCAALKTRG